MPRSVVPMLSPPGRLVEHFVLGNVPGKDDVAPDR